MTRPIQFQLDEHLGNAIARALRRRGITAQTVHEAGIRGRPDHQILAWCNAEQRVVVTFDDDYLRLHHENTPHQGIVYFGPNTRSVGQIISDLILIHEVLDADEIVGKLEFF